MDERYFTQLVEWLENNLDVEAGLPVIFDGYLQEKLENALRGDNGK